MGIREIMERRRHVNRVAESQAWAEFQKVKDLESHSDAVERRRWKEIQTIKAAKKRALREQLQSGKLTLQQLKALK